MKNFAIAAQASVGAVTPLEQRDAALRALAAGSRLGAEEIARLDVDGVDLLSGHVELRGRDGAPRRISADRSALRALASYLERARAVLAAADPEPALFLSKSGRRLTASDVRRRLGSGATGRPRTRVESTTLRTAYLRSHPRA
jgi:site-specific recombinase XerC